MASIFRPNMDDLQKEWANYPELIHKWARIAAVKRNDMDVAKANMELVEAELANKIQNKPHKYGFTDQKAPAQASIKAAVIRQPEFQKAQKVYFEARLQHGLAEAAATASSGKKAALENLVILWMRDYWSAPKLAPEHAEEFRQKVKNDVTKSFKVTDPKKKKEVK